MISGYSLGGVVASVIGLFLSEQYGWRVLFYAGGVQLLIIPLVLRVIPPDINSLIHSGDKEAVNLLLKKANGEYKPDVNSRVISRHRKHDQHSVLELLNYRQRYTTLIFWMIFFGCLLVSYSIINWLPKIILARGLAVESSFLFFVTLNVGAIIGGVLGGVLGDKYSTGKVLTLFFVVCAFCLVLIGQVESKELLYVLVVLLGGTTIGSQTLVYILIAHHHAAPLRSTAIAWASGVGRIGAISGPVVGGVLIGSYLTVGAYLVSISIFALLAALATMLVPKSEAEH
jgi:AAHS family benzoate transporter-like MFS transporter